MPRRRKTESISPLLLLIIGALVLIVIRDNDLTEALFVFGIPALVALVVLVVLPKMKHRRLFDRIQSITGEHIAALIRQRTILVRTDPYGKPLLENWHSEIDYFVTHHIRPRLKQKQIALLEKQRAGVRDLIDQQVSCAAQMRPPVPTISTNMTSAEFEAFCAERLRECGWDVRVTPFGHDQGVDVIAEKDGTRVALQCKLYSNPVGNKAVQEIAAGRVHQQAHHGAVVTNGTFTASAKELASTNGIRLLHYTELPSLKSIIDETVIR